MRERERKRERDRRLLRAHTWAGLTGHGVLLDVWLCVGAEVARLMHPPVRPLSKQNPTGRERQTSQVQTAHIPAVIRKKTDRGARL